jgi:hypothetical protein
VTEAAAKPTYERSEGSAQLQNAVWFLLLTAVGIPVDSAVSTWVINRLNRSLTRETALLSASQKRREVEISQLRDAHTDLLTAATAVQSFVWYVDRDVRLRTKIDVDDWQATRGFIEPAVIAAQRLRAIARAMPTDELRDVYIAVEQLIMKVIRGSDDPDAPDAWDEDVAGPQPDTITRAVNATADRIKQLYDAYPSELGTKPISPQLAPTDQNRSIPA